MNEKSVIRGMSKPTSTHSSKKVPFLFSADGSDPIRQYSSQLAKQQAVDQIVQHGGFLPDQGPIERPNERKEQEHGRAAAAFAQFSPLPCKRPR